MYYFLRECDASHACSDGKDIGIIMEACVFCHGGIGAEGTSCSADLVGSDGDANATAADDDAGAVFLDCCTGNGIAKVWVVNGLLMVASEVFYGVSL